MHFLMTYYLKILIWYFVMLTLESNAVVNGGIIPLSTKSVYSNLMRINTLPIDDCGSRYNIKYLSISSCTTLPCHMQRGTTVKVNVFFDDNGNDISFLKHRVRWVFNAVKTDAEITPDPCDGNQECIADGLDGKTYWAYVFVSASLPVLRGTMLWETIDQYNNEVLCFHLPVIITI